MKRTSIIIVLLLASVFLVGTAWGGPTKPTDEQKRAIQEKINSIRPEIEGHERCRAREDQAIEDGRDDWAKIWADMAVLWATLATDTCNEIIEDVDRDYEIPAPPNTTISYNPDCKGTYGTCYGKKGAIRVDLHPSVFTDGPGLIASTKIHELTHAQQIASCMSSNPGYWTPCQFWDHYSEWEAYSASERAYDQGIVDFPPDPDPNKLPPHKRRISQAIIDRRNAALKAYLETLGFFAGARAEVAKGEVATLDFTLYNPDAALHNSSIVVTDTLGWTITPGAGFASPVAIDPEEDIVMSVEVSVPPGTMPGTVNPLTVLVDGISSDTMFLVVTASVGVVGGDAMQVDRLAMMEAPFTIINRGTASETYDLLVTNPLGWSASVVPTTVTLAAGAQLVVPVMVTVPDVAEKFVTNLLTLSATAQSDPTQSASASTSLEIREPDVCVLGVFSPLDAEETGVAFTPQVVVFNIGHIDSFFDVFMEIRDPSDSVVASESYPVPLLPAGAEHGHALAPVTLNSAGTYTIRTWTALAGDADPTNDMLIRSFEVSGDTRVPDWMLLERNQ